MESIRSGLDITEVLKVHYTSFEADVNVTLNAHLALKPSIPVLMGIILTHRTH